MENSPKILIDCDGGADDLVALTLATKGLSIQGIVASYGNFTAYESQHRVCQWIKANHLSDTLVGLGALTPLRKSYTPSYTIHGKSFLKKFRPPSRFQYFWDHLRTQARIGKFLDLVGQVDTYITLGPLTTLAYLSETSAANRISQIIIMGGALNYPGNQTPLAEANFWWDPQAAKKVLTTWKNITIVPLNITESLAFSLSLLDHLPVASQHLWKKLLKTYHAFYTKEKKWYFDPQDFSRKPFTSCPLHDTVAVMTAIRPDLFTIKKIALSLDYLELLDGAIVLTENNYYKKSANFVTLKVVIGVDKKNFWKEVVMLMLAQHH